MTVSTEENFKNKINYFPENNKKFNREQPKYFWYDKKNLAFWLFPVFGSLNFIKKNKSYLIDEFSFNNIMYLSSSYVDFFVFSYVIVEFEKPLF